ncbi:MAG: hypothetical protein OXP66_11325 [Candidatus Tectomicrobia bacterium]|nr:hypothetical protein [Candidatus Tectomicrobia bacterium]
MIISIVNDTSLCRQEVQTTIRAVNRQLQEDFRPYWHIDAQLRLEGRTEEALDPNWTFNMRGDGVIYLTEEYDAGRALGYHERNLRVNTLKPLRMTRRRSTTSVRRPAATITAARPERRAGSGVRPAPACIQTDAAA